jgi:hypothetical protein
MNNQINQKNQIFFKKNFKKKNKLRIQFLRTLKNKEWKKEKVF